MMFAVTTEGITFSATQIWAIGGGLVAAIALLYRQISASHQRTVIELEALKKTYQDFSAEALKSALDTTNHYRVKEGKAPLVPLAPVISESRSPSTAKQRETAAIQTMRATMAMIKLASGQIPRPEPEKAVEP